MTCRRFLPRLFALFAIALFLAIGCQPQAPQTAPDTPAPPDASAAPVYLNGTGATFPLFLYQRWFSEYNKLHPNVQINYQPIGSAAGIQQVISETVDFGASDVAMTDEEVAQVQKGVVLIPVTAGSVAIAYNLPDIESGLKLSREVLPEIFLGSITTWNDPKIAAENPDLTLPDLPIIPVYRSDGSGTTAVVTAHLSAISPEWQDRVGSGLSVQWQAGVGIKSNAGVSAQVQQEAGTIGYVEFSYAKQLGLAIAALENKAGQYVLPSTASAAAALGTVTFPEDDLRVFIPDPEGEASYPIVTYSWLLAYEKYEDPAKADTLKEVIRWGLTDGQAFSEELGYVPLPESVVEKASAALEKIQS